MANPKILYFLVLAMLYISVAKCQSISVAPSYSYHVPASSPRAVPVPALLVSPAHHSPALADPPMSVAYSPAIPASPSYPGTPVSPPYLAVPVASPPPSIAQPPPPSETPQPPMSIVYPPAIPASPSYPRTLVSPSYPAVPVASPPLSIAQPPPPSAQPPMSIVYSPAIPASPSYPGTFVSPSSPAVPIASPPLSIAQPPVSRSPAPLPSEPVRAAYWPSFKGLNASSIDTTHLSHIYYAFLSLDPVTYKLIISPSDHNLVTLFIDTLHLQNSPVKSLLSIGGADFNQTNYFSNMSLTQETRAVFINSTIEVARNYGFDGVDLDWEFPSNDQEMYNLALLLKELRKALEIEARTSGKPRLLLTAAVYYSSRIVSHGDPRSYPVQAINNYVDWINPMCYDYHGSWENFTGPNAALFDPFSNLSTDYGIGSWIESGVWPTKLVMGLPLYGRTWILQDPSVYGFGAPATGAGPGDGILGYSEIKEFNVGNQGIVHFDGVETVSYYSVFGNTWIGYDDVMSVDRKIQFAQSRGLAGYFFWALGMDIEGTLIGQASSSWDAE